MGTVGVPRALCCSRMNLCLVRNLCCHFVRFMTRGLPQQLLLEGRAFTSACNYVAHGLFSPMCGGQSHHPSAYMQTGDDYRGRLRPATPGLAGARRAWCHAAPHGGPSGGCGLCCFGTAATCQQGDIAHRRLRGVCDAVQHGWVTATCAHPPVPRRRALIWLQCLSKCLVWLQSIPAQQ